ncbi:MAG: hypothetical protein H0X24_09695 [Ktedonobacterales bacterium]|nr:hypothetical protein [Ktedonobacterales bacterium]
MGLVWPNRQIIDVWRPPDLTAPTTLLQVANTLDRLGVIPAFTTPPVSAIFAVV